MVWPAAYIGIKVLAKAATILVAKAAAKALPAGIVTSKWGMFVLRRVLRMTLGSGLEYAVLKFVKGPGALELVTGLRGPINRYHYTVEEEDRAWNSVKSAVACGPACTQSTAHFRKIWNRRLAKEIRATTHQPSISSTFMDKLDRELAEEQLVLSEIVDKVCATAKPADQQVKSWLRQWLQHKAMFPDLKLSPADEDRLRMWMERASTSVKDRKQCDRLLQLVLHHHYQLENYELLEFFEVLSKQSNHPHCAPPLQTVGNTKQGWTWFGRWSGNKFTLKTAM